MRHRPNCIGYPNLPLTMMCEKVAGITLEASSSANEHAASSIINAVSTLLDHAEVHIDQHGPSDDFKTMYQLVVSSLDYPEPVPTTQKKYSAPSSDFRHRSGANVTVTNPLKRRIEFSTTTNKSGNPLPLPDHHLSPFYYPESISFLAPEDASRMLVAVKFTLNTLLSEENLMRTGILSPHQIQNIRPFLLKMVEQMTHSADTPFFLITPLAVNPRYLFQEFHSQFPNGVGLASSFNPDWGLGLGELLNHDHGQDFLHILSKAGENFLNSTNRVIHIPGMLDYGNVKINESHLLPVFDLLENDAVLVYIPNFGMQLPLQHDIEKQPSPSLNPKQIAQRIMLILDLAGLWSEKQLICADDYSGAIAAHMDEIIIDQRHTGKKRVRYYVRDMADANNMQEFIRRQRKIIRLDSVAHGILRWLGRQVVSDMGDLSQFVDISDSSYSTLNAIIRGRNSISQRLLHRFVDHPEHARLVFTVPSLFSPQPFITRLKSVYNTGPRFRYAHFYDEEQKREELLSFAREAFSA